MHLNHWQSQIAVGNDGTGFVQSQSPTPNLFRQDRQLSLGEFQEQQVVHQEEQVPPHQVQLHNFESRPLLPTHPPNLSRPDAAMGWNAMAATAASTTHSPGWWISQEISYPNHQSFDRDLSPYTLAKSPWEDTSTTTGPASDIGTGTTSRKRSITTVALDNGNNNADKSTESIEGHTDCDPNNNAKRSIRSERKRELEKQRRLDLNERYNTLITVLSRIEKEDEQRDMQPSNQDEERAQSGSSESDPSEQGNGTEKSPSTTQSETGPQENSARTAAAMTSAARLEHKRLFPTHISSSNRADLIARTVSHLALYGRIRKQQESTIRSLKDKLKEMERNRAENERKLKDIEGYGGGAAAATMAQPLAIPLSATVGDGGKDTTVKSKPELESVDGHSPSPSVESMIVGRQQQQQQQRLYAVYPHAYAVDGCPAILQHDDEGIPVPSGGNVVNGPTTTITPSSSSRIEIIIVCECRAPRSPRRGYSGDDESIDANKPDPRRKPGIGNYTKPKLENMFAAIKAILPVEGEDWDDVADLHAKQYPGRDAESICNKCNRLNQKMAPTGYPNMRWDCCCTSTVQLPPEDTCSDAHPCATLRPPLQAKELKELIDDKAFIVKGEDRYDAERNEFTPPPPPTGAAVTTQPVPLLLGQPTQPTQPEEVTQFEVTTQQSKVAELTPTSTITSSSKKRHYNCKANNKSKMRNDKADEERKIVADEHRKKVLLQTLLAQLTSGGGGGRGVGCTTSPITPQVGTPQVTNVTYAEGKIAAEEGKLKRKVNSLQHRN
eukprot:jgi/Psemu1/33883/gm1.33883_g